MAHQPSASSAAGAVGPVAAEQVGAADLDLARVARRRAPAPVSSTSRSSMPGSGRADGAGLRRPAAQGAGDDRRRLGQAVALVDGDRRWPR